jgi:hypothetical protein
VTQPAPAPRFSRTPAAIRTVENGPQSLAEAIAAWRPARD